MPTWEAHAAAVLRGAASALPLEAGDRRAVAAALEACARDGIVLGAFAKRGGTPSPGALAPEAAKELEKSAAQAWKDFLSISERKKIEDEARAVARSDPAKGRAKPRELAARLARALLDEKALAGPIAAAAAAGPRTSRAAPIAVAVVAILIIALASRPRGSSPSPSVDAEGRALPEVARGLVVVTRPPGAEVFIDDARRIGTSPCAVEQVAPGRHVIQAQLGGHEPAETAVEVKDGERADATLELVPFSGTIVVELDGPASISAAPVTGASAVVKAYVEAPPFVARLERVPVGRWVVRATSGRRDAEAPVDVRRKTESRVLLTLGVKGPRPQAAPPLDPTAAPPEPPRPSGPPLGGEKPLPPAPPTPPPPGVEWLDGDVPQAKLGVALAAMKALAESDALSEERRAKCTARGDALARRADALKKDVREPLTIVPGKGLNGIVLGVATLDDVRRVFGTKSERLDRGCWDGRPTTKERAHLEYSERAGGSPRSFKLEDDVVVEIQFTMFQSDLQVAGGLRFLRYVDDPSPRGERTRHGATRADVVTVLGSGFTPGVERELPYLLHVKPLEGLELLRWEAKGIEVAVEKDHDQRMIAARIFIPKG